MVLFSDDMKAKPIRPVSTVKTGIEGSRADWVTYREHFRPPSAAAMAAGREMPEIRQSMMPKYTGPMAKDPTTYK
jgi:hypothetical protein